MIKMGSNIENDTPSANGANVVAIDNKIEQAMDLVKTHLLYAVREEVEVLKERIVELETKIARLESENKLLRKHAPTEVVQFIQQQQLQEEQDPKPPPVIRASSDSSAVTQSQSQHVSNILTASQIQQPPSAGVP